jgi:hypothetical protein
MADLTQVPWHTGRTLGRTLYARTGGDDYKADTPAGMLDTRELADEACGSHNAMLDLAALAAAGFDVCLGTRKAQGAAGVYVSLEHLDLDEPEEFYAPAFPEAVAKAREWAERRAAC